MASALSSSCIDPSATDGRVDKMGLDATRPLDADPFTYTVVHVPGQDDDALDDWVAQSAPNPHGPSIKPTAQPTTAPANSLRFRAG